MPRNSRCFAVVVCLVLCFSSLLFAQTSDQTAAKVVTAMDSGVGFHVGQFDVSISGEINGFYVHDRADNSSGLDTTVPNSQAQGFACALCSASTGAQPSSSIRNGLLPGDLSFKIATQERGIDVAVFFGIWPEIQNNSLLGNGRPPQSFGGVVATNGGANGATNALGTPGIDFRQQFATIGKAHLGTLKIGRDLGLFGQEGILYDMTLLGAGTPNGNVGPGSVTLGRIGVGYIYTDFVPQITYTTPSVHGAQAAIGIIQAYDDITAPALNGHGQPMIQGKLTYTAGKKLGKAKFFSNVLTQSMEANNGGAYGLAQGQSVRSWGVDYGTKLDYHGADLVLYGYNGQGAGITGLLIGGISTVADNGVRTMTRASQGYYAQGTYTIHRVTAGFSYGQSNLSPVNLADRTAFAGVVRNNQSYVTQLRYAATKWDNLLVEYTHTRSEAQSGLTASSDSIAAGTIVFF